MSIRGETLPDYVWIKLKDKLPSWLIHLLQFFPSVVDFIFSSILKTTSGYLAEVTISKIRQTKNNKRLTTIV